MNIENYNILNNTPTINLATFGLSQVFPQLNQKYKIFIGTETNDDVYIEGVKFTSILERIECLENMWKRECMSVAKRCLNRTILRVSDDCIYYIFTYLN